MVKELNGGNSTNREVIISNYAHTFGSIAGNKNAKTQGERKYKLNEIIRK